MGGRERDLSELSTLIESSGCSVAAVHRADAIVILETVPNPIQRSTET
jgi:hypothetical protein